MTVVTTSPDLAEAFAAVYRRVMPDLPLFREILAGIGTAVGAAGGGFMMHYTTVAVTAARADAHT